MADKRKGKRRVEKENDKPCSKEEYAIAKHLRFNVPTRDAKFIPMGTIVKTFVASKVVDALMDSKWAKSGKGEIQFTDRKSCVTFCDKLLTKGLFHRALKIDRPKKKRRKVDDTGAEEERKVKKERKGKKDKEKLKEKEKETEKDQEEESKVEERIVKKDEKKDDEKKKEKKDDEKKKKEKKIHVDMHEDQRFVDGDDLYVWIYDPVPAKTFIIGLLMVLGAAALCVFPLWPDELRVGVYYCSLVGASFVGFILVLVVIRFILFCALWLTTFGKLHFWLLPNLTEDVGFFDSFRPLYKYDVLTGNEKEEKEERKRLKREKREKELEEERHSLEEEEEEAQEQEFEMVRPEDVEEESENKEKIDDNLEDAEVEEEDEEYENEDDEEEDDGKFDDNDEEESTNGNDTETKKDK